MTPKNLMYDSEISHLEVADLLYLEYIILEFFKQKCFKNNLENDSNEINKILNKICSDNSNKDFVKNMLINLSWRLGDIHKALGWIK